MTRPKIDNTKQMLIQDCIELAKAKGFTNTKTLVRQYSQSKESLEKLYKKLEGLK